MGEERYIIIDGKKTRISYFTPEQEAIFASIEEEMWESDRATELGYAKREGYKEGYEKGIKEGIEQVRNEYREQEIKEGRKEGKIEIASRMLEKNKSIEEIIELTGLEKEEIQKLIK